MTGVSVAAAKGRLFHGRRALRVALTLKQIIAGRNAATFDWLVALPWTSRTFLHTGLVKRRNECLGWRRKMWIVKLALNRPCTFIVAAILILILGFTSIATTSTDVFPNIDIRIILCSEHTIDRSAHLFQNKSRRQAIHHFELIRLTWTNFKSIGLHSFDGDF